MKNTLIMIILAMAATVIHAQTMKWIPMQSGLAKGPCTLPSGSKQQDLCYALEYTPTISGTLTSYTTGFFVSCTSMGSAISKNQSCTMINNVNLVNGCNGTGIVLMNSSGNSGSIANSKVEAGVPVIIHEVCFSIPYGESITIKEDPITDLTTSVDISNGVYQTEYPAYETMTIRRDRPDASRPLWLDFKSIAAGDLISQLDWSTTEFKGNSRYIVERSADGNEFVTIGSVDGSEKPGAINSYQYFDKSALTGINYYRLRQVAEDGKTEFSPVRTVSFSAKAFSVKVSPNPANDYLMVEIQSPVAINTMRLFDASGRVVMDEKNDNKLLTSRLDVKKLNAGIYTLVVETAQDKYTEKVVIAH